VIPPPQTVPAVSGDAEDDTVLSCAVAAQADYIVSGDKRHMLPLGEYQQIRIVSPVEFLGLIQ
ncbi:MAG: PIN domain-containing protein, partial [Fimbriimonadales bacterium]|nr:PIN domain-containing protein [Fimbriimonadales bacterium]